MDCKNTRTEKPTFRSKGFTLVELLVVIAIIVVLATVSTGIAGRAIQKAKQTQVLAQFRDVSVGIQGFIVDYSRPPLPEAARTAGTDTVYGGPSSEEKNNFVMGALMPNDTTHFVDIQDKIKSVNPRAEVYANIAFSPKKQTGLGDDGILYDPWGKEILIAVNAPPFQDETATGSGGTKDRFLETGNLAVYIDAKPRDQDYVLWTYGKDGKKGKPASKPDAIVGFAGSDDVVSFR